MLLGDLEVPYEGGHVSIKSEDHASDNDNNKGAEFTPLNANAGTLVKVNRKGDEIEIKKVSQ